MTFHQEPMLDWLLDEPWQLTETIGSFFIQQMNQ